MPRLSPWSRLQLVERVLAGRPAAHVAAEMGVSRATAYKWLRRFRAEGVAGLQDRSSRPRSSPTRTDPAAEATIVALRRDRRLGPARIAGIVGLPASTVHRVLVRHGMPRLAWLDRPTGEPVRRYERARPGELVHVDVKKIGRLRPGGGWRVLGRDSPEHRRARNASRVGYEYVHCAIDDHTRLAYAEIHPDERADTCAAFLRRAAAWFAEHGVPRIERVMTDNALTYRRSAAWRQALHDLGASPRFTRRYRPQTNGKAERFNRTLLEEWAYARPFTSGQDRADALPTWLHTYNHHRTHTALGGLTPIDRVNNLPGHYS
ncbi:IS481 family transposase [Cellulomonas endophytica]|uniref:IS481 family transposase n=1 Tax=Cellulomonas endophytica TaxID=2494735 RepID=UPI001012FD31|nr:IS481 family transposase [Cellulomonas endophytica]